MMRLNPATLDAIRQHFLLTDIVGAKVALKQRGKEYIGLCPFHQEKSPSFTVNNDKHFFHCFGCHAHGDVIGFVMQTERITFAEAAELLASKAGIILKAPTKAELQREKTHKDLYQALSAARGWYQSQLFGPDGAQARNYLLERGIDDDMIRRYGIGWAPAHRHAVSEVLKSQGFSIDQLIETGLVIRHESGGSHDRFRSRIMFPITDITQRVIAFGGRLFISAGMPNIDAPKYLNSPETSLFHKSKVLYGEASAIAAIRTGGNTIVSEGYIDVIALQNAGFTHSVATLGTAVTEAHLTRLWKLAPEIIICMDGDRAGKAAAIKVAIQSLSLLTPKHSIHFVILPEGQDPDELIHRHGAAAMTQLLAQKCTLAEMLWRHQNETITDQSPDGMAALETALMHYAEQLSTPALKRAYRHYFYTQLRTRRLSQTYTYTSSTSQQAKRLPASASPMMTTQDEREHLEHGMLALVVLTPTLLERPDILDYLMQSELSTKELDRARSFILDKIVEPSFSTESCCLIDAFKTEGLAHFIEHWQQLAMGWRALNTPELRCELWWFYHDKWVLCYLKAEYEHVSRHQDNQQDETQLTRLHALHQEIKQQQAKITARLALLQPDDI